MHWQSATQVLVHATKISFLNPNAGTRLVEKAKTGKYKLLCQQRGMDFVSINFTASGGMGGHFQAQYWNDSSGIRTGKVMDSES
jgi:hypothetical protein